MSYITPCRLSGAGLSARIENINQDPIASQTLTSTVGSGKLVNLPEKCADLNITRSTELPYIAPGAAACEITLRPYTNGWECTGDYPRETCVPSDERSVKKEASCTLGFFTVATRVTEADPNKTFVEQRCECSISPSEEATEPSHVRSDARPDPCEAFCHDNAIQMFRNSVVQKLSWVTEGPDKSVRVECLADLYLDVSPLDFSFKPKAPPKGSYVYDPSEPFGYGICKNVPFPEDTHYSILPPPKPGYCFFLNDDGSVEEFGSACDFCVCGIESRGCVYKTVASNATMDNVIAASASRVRSSLGLDKEFYVTGNAVLSVS